MRQRLLTLCITLLVLLLCSCGAAGSSVETLSDWSFQYNEATDDYSLFFALRDKSDEFVSADATVEIRIENDNGETVYEATRTINEEDFGSYTNQTAGERYLADVKIDASDIRPGTASNGTVYFTVTNDSTFSFDECNCSALYCLPVKEIGLAVDSLPLELEQKDFDGKIASKLTVTDVQYTVDTTLDSPIMTVTISGEKTYGANDALTSYDIISYKLCDSQGYIVDSGDVYLTDSLSAGDKFKDDSLMFYDLTPGENYTLQLAGYEW